MLDYEKTVVPLDDGHEILAAFGIGPDNPEYQRWRRDDGFRLIDFEGVLGTSPSVLSVDWREWLQDAMDTISTQLKSFEIVPESDLGEDGEAGIVEIDGTSERIKYVPGQEGDFGDVIAAVNRLVAAKAQYRKLRSCEGSDGWLYGLLTNDKWKELENTASATVNLLFTSVL
jgi:hypothetical protein